MHVTGLRIHLEEDILTSHQLCFETTDVWVTPNGLVPFGKLLFRHMTGLERWQLEMGVCGGGGGVHGGT